MPSRPLSVLQVITTVDVGGAEHHLLGLCRGLVSRGHRVELRFLKGKGTLADRFVDLGVTPRRARIDGVAGPVEAFAKLFTACRRGGFDVVHTHLLKANFLGALAARLAGVPGVVASKHNDEPQLRNVLVRPLHRLASRLDDAFVHASAHIERYMVEVGGLDPAKGRVIRYGVGAGAEPVDGAAVRRELGLPPEAFVVICVARLVRRKGHATLLEAFRAVCDETAGEVRLLVVGDGPMAGELHALAGRLELGERVHFLGERLDVQRLLAAADVFALASTAEGLGLVLLEAMAAGLPVVATAVGGMVELVEQERTGLLVPPADPAALAAAISRLVVDRRLAASFGGKGARRAHSDFAEQSMVESVVAVYRDVLDGRRLGC